MHIRLLVSSALVFFAPALLWCQTVTGPVVRFHTTQGDIDVTLLPNSAPRTVANFLNYVNKGAYDNSFIHRSVPGFIWQGGGYKWVNNAPKEIPQDPAVRNEFSVSNLRGTLAMAKLSGDANSATNQWFFNLGNNATALNTTNGGYTVFGRVANTASMDVVDNIAAAKVPSIGLSSPFDQLPLVDYTIGSPVLESNLIEVISITQVDTTPVPVITKIISSSGFGGFPAAAPGSMIEISGTNLAGDVSRSWKPDDFTNGNAPTTLEGVSVTVGGKAAFVNSISKTLVVVQVPGDVPTDSSLPVVLSYKTQSSTPSMLPVKPVVAGLLAPPNFKVNDVQYVSAVDASTLAYATSGNIDGITGTPAAPGETLLFYGNGFGAITSDTVPLAGKIVDGDSAVVVTVQFKIGGLDAPLGFAGLAQGLVGVYQFNVTVPADAPDGDLPVEVTVGGDMIAQTLFLPVQTPPPVPPPDPGDTGETPQSIRR